MSENDLEGMDTEKETYRAFLSPSVPGIESGRVHPSQLLTPRPTCSTNEESVSPPPIQATRSTSSTHIVDVTESTTQTDRRTKTRVSR